MRRAPRPQLPLFTGELVSLEDYRAAEGAALTEREAQRALIAELRNPNATRGPVLAFHIPNGIPLPSLDPALKAKIWRAFEADGALPGAADLVIGHGGRTLFRELKRAKGGALSDAQKAFRDLAQAAGLDWAVWNGADAARAELQKIGALR